MSCIKFCFLYVIILIISVRVKIEGIVTAFKTASGQKWKDVGEIFFVILRLCQVWKKLECFSTWVGLLVGHFEDEIRN